MEWLNTILTKGLKANFEKAEDLSAAVEALETAVSKELPLHFMPKAEYNSKADELKSAAAQLQELNGKIEKLSTDAGDSEKLKEELAEAKTAYETYKAETEKRQTNSLKVSAVEKALRKSGAAEDAIDLLIPQFTLDNIIIDTKGEIVDWEEVHLKPVKETRTSVFTTKETENAGGGGGNPGGGGEDSGEIDMAAYYKDLDMKPFNQK